MRKSADMLKDRMIVILDGKQRVIRNITPGESALGPILKIECEDDSTFNRTPGAKIEVIGRVSKRR